MKATYKNTPDEFSAEQRSSGNLMDNSEVINQISSVLILITFLEK
jgi:hypothetical protein